MEEQISRGEFVEEIRSMISVRTGVTHARPLDGHSPVARKFPCLVAVLSRGAFFKIVWNNVHYFSEIIIEIL